MLNNLISQQTKIYMYKEPVHMSNQIDGLKRICINQIGQDPRTNSLFLFCNKKQDKIKILKYTGDGYALYYKRKDHGTFNWPLEEGCRHNHINLNYADIEELVKGAELDEFDGMNNISSSL